MRKLKLGFLVRRKMRRWSEGKGPLTKEQLNFLDKEFLKTFYDQSRLNWYFTQEYEQNPHYDQNFNKLDPKWKRLMRIR